MPKQSDKQTDSMRLDKWLWCARFYKTRGLAAEAIKSGKIVINNEKVKPSRMVEPGIKIKIRRGPFSYNIEILSLVKTRKSATEAVLLYKENQESIEKREMISTQLKMAAMSTPRTEGRPTKRDRRQLMRFRNKD